MDPGPTAVLAPPEALSRPGRLDALRRLPEAAGRVLRHAEFWLVLVLAGLTFVVHDVPYLLRWPFWTDEAWVAVTTRFPLSQLPAVTSSTPIGWSLLLRLFTVGGQQWLRLLPLCFAALTVAVAYVFGRGLGWRDRRLGVLAGTLAAAAALMSPAMLVRNDLKQYTADACLALAVLAVLSRLERDWSRRRLAQLAAVCAGGMLLSHTTLFVGVAAFGAVAVVQLLRRAWRRVLETAAAGLAAGAGMGLVYVVFDARAVVPGLTSFWNAYYIPLNQGPRAALSYLRRDLGLLHSSIGLGPTWLIAVFALLGLIALVRAARPTVALAIVLLAPELVAASGLKKYPLLDERTSTFLMVVMVVLAAVGIAGLCSLIAAPAAESVRPWGSLRSPRNLGAVALAVAAAGVFITVSAKPDLRVHDLSSEDVRTQTAYVYAHRAPDDIVLVNLNSNWGFAYYWPQGTPSQSPSSDVLQKYLAVFPDQPQIVVARNRDVPGVQAALAQALARARTHPGARIWVIRTHLNVGERAAWSSALQTDGLTLQTVDSAGLSVITPGG